MSENFWVLSLISQQNFMIRLQWSSFPLSIWVFREAQAAAYVAGSSLLLCLQPDGCEAVRASALTSTSVCRHRRADIIHSAEFSRRALLTAHYLYWLSDDKSTFAWHDGWHWLDCTCWTAVIFDFPTVASNSNKYFSWRHLLVSWDLIVLAPCIFLHNVRINVSWWRSKAGEGRQKLFLKILAMTSSKALEKHKERGGSA